MLTYCYWLHLKQGNKIGSRQCSRPLCGGSESWKTNMIISMLHI